MPYVMLYDTWMKDTEARFKPRSDRLKEIDKAIQQYHSTKSDEDLTKLKRALHLWKMWKGYDASAGKPAWIISERNKKGAIRDLDLQLFGVRDKSALEDLSDQPYYGIESWAPDLEARLALKAAREESLQQIFYGREFYLPETALALTVVGLRRQLNKTRDQAKKTVEAVGASAVGTAKSAAMSAARPLINQVRPVVDEIIAEVLKEFPLEVAREVMALLAQLIPDFIMEFTTSIAPYISLAPNTFKAVKNGYSVAKTQFHLGDIDEHALSLAAGDPAAAAKALRRLFERKRNNYAKLASIYTADVTIKASALALDSLSLGIPTVSSVVTPLQGLITATSILTVQIHSLAREVQEMRRANEILSKGAVITADIFETCPIAGCYFVACSNTSSIINFLIEDIGAPGWQRDIESLKKHHVDPLIQDARSLISDSRIQVKGLEMSQGVVKDVTPGCLGMSNIKNRLQRNIMAKLKNTA